MEGHVKLHRKILSWEWYSDINTCRLFIHLLLRANWKSGRYMGTNVERGELVITYPILASETGLSVKEVRTALNHLLSTEEIEIKRQAKFSVITIKNYNAYQQWAEDGQSGSRQKAGNRQAENSQKARKNQQKIEHQAGDGQSKGSQGAGSKEEEEGKKEIKQEGNKKAFCPEAETSAPGENVVGAFILNDGSEYNVTENDMETFQKLYPGIDCLQELRNLTGWCLTNPRHRKTRSGARRFLNNWLMRAQNSARPEEKSPLTFSASKNRFHNFDQRETDYDALMMQKLQERMNNQL